VPKEFKELKVLLVNLLARVFRELKVFREFRDFKALKDFKVFKDCRVFRGYKDPMESQ
jgi:hypothetical protein